MPGATVAGRHPPRVCQGRVWPWPADSMLTSEWGLRRPPCGLSPASRPLPLSRSVVCAGPWRGLWWPPCWSLAGPCRAWASKPSYCTVRGLSGPPGGWPRPAGSPGPPRSAGCAVGPMEGTCAAAAGAFLRRGESHETQPVGDTQPSVPVSLGPAGAGGPLCGRPRRAGRWGPGTAPPASTCRPWGRRGPAEASQQASSQQALLPWGSKGYYKPWQTERCQTGARGCQARQRTGVSTSPPACLGTEALSSSLTHTPTLTNPHNTHEPPLPMVWLWQPGGQRRADAGRDTEKERH